MALRLRPENESILTRPELLEWTRHGILVRNRPAKIIAIVTGQACRWHGMGYTPHVDFQYEVGRQGTAGRA